jgi:hypothetical protein
MDGVVPYPMLVCGALYNVPMRGSASASGQATAENSDRILYKQRCVGDSIHTAVCVKTRLGRNITQLCCLRGAESEELGRARAALYSWKAVLSLPELRPPRARSP